MKNFNDAKVALINPPGTFIKDAKLVIHHGIPNLGMAYVCGALKKSNIQYKLIDAIGEDINRYRKHPKNDNIFIRGLSYDEIIEKLPDNPKFICIGTNYSTDWLFTAEFIERLKTIYPYCKIILGGENPTAYWDKILKYEDAVDICVLGEGDETIVNVITAFETNADLKTVKGIAFRDKDKNVIKNERPGRIKNLNDFYPDWDQFPLENYFNNRTAVRSYGKRTMPMIASRGCPYQCTFCNSLNKWGTTQIVRDPVDVIAEMKMYRDKYKIDHICIVDLASTANGKWFLEFCNKMIEADLGITWEMSSGTRSELLSYENLKLVKKAKNIHLSLSPESGSKRMLKLIKKELNLDHIEQVVKDCFKVGIRVKTNFVVGLRSQTISEINQTYISALKYAWYGADDIAIYAYVPFPGTEMHNRLIESGELKINTREEYEEYNLKLSTYSFVAVTKSHVEKTYPIHILNILTMLACFIIALIRKPIRIPQFFWNILTGRAIGVFEVAGYSLLKWPFLILKMHLDNMRENKTKRLTYRMSYEKAS